MTTSKAACMLAMGVDFLWEWSHVLREFKPCTTSFMHALEMGGEVSKRIKACISMVLPRQRMLGQSLQFCSIPLDSPIPTMFVWSVLGNPGRLSVVELMRSVAVCFHE